MTKKRIRRLRAIAARRRLYRETFVRFVQSIDTALARDGYSIDAAYRPSSRGGI